MIKFIFSRLLNEEKHICNREMIITQPNTFTWFKWLYVKFIDYIYDL